eukprot:2288088-Prymnesium_polylepis.1
MLTHAGRGLVERRVASDGCSQWAFAPACPDEALLDALAAPLGGGEPLAASFGDDDPWRRRPGLAPLC